MFKEKKKKGTPKREFKSSFTKKGIQIKFLKKNLKNN